MRSARQPRPRFYVLPVEGTLVAPITSGLVDEVQALLDRGERLIVLNLARVTDIDAAGVGELVRAHNVATAAGAVLWVGYTREDVRRMLEAAGVLELLSAYTAP